jgi:putative membrane protein
MKTVFHFTVAGIFALFGVTSFTYANNLNDAQIAGIVVAANTVDIDAGKLAEEKSKDKEIKAFAKRMVTDHSAVNEQATTLVKKLNVTPAQSETSKSLTQNGSKTADSLKGLDGKAFDKAYVDNEIAYHKTVLDALDTTLIPNAKNEELKALLLKVRPAFVAHLEHAKRIQASLK